MGDIGRDAIQIAMVNYGGNALKEFDLDRYLTKEALNTAIDRVGAVQGRTHTTAALEMLLDQIFVPNNGDRGDVPNIGVLITDGRANIREAEIPVVAQRLRDSGLSPYKLINLSLL